MLPCKIQGKKDTEKEEIERKKSKYIGPYCFRSFTYFIFRSIFFNQLYIIWMEVKVNKKLCNYVSFYDSHILRDYKYVFSYALLPLTDLIFPLYTYWWENIIWVSTTSSSSYKAFHAILMRINVYFVFSYWLLFFFFSYKHIYTYTLGYCVEIEYY